MKISYLTQEFDVQPTRTVRVRPTPQLSCFRGESTLFHSSLRQEHLQQELLRKWIGCRMAELQHLSSKATDLV